MNIHHVRSHDPPCRTCDAGEPAHLDGQGVPAAADVSEEEALDCASRRVPVHVFKRKGVSAETRMSTNPLGSFFFLVFLIGRLVLCSLCTHFACRRVQTKHHNTYVTNVNNVLAGDNGGALKGLSLSAIQKEVVSLPDSIKTAVRNSGGGHWNHSFFWSVMGKTGSIAEAPTGDLKSSIESTFGSLDEMQKKFNTAAASRFGSGWAWLSVNADGQLFISSTPNQDNPLMEGIVDQPGTPILGLDVWEHVRWMWVLMASVSHNPAFSCVWRHACEWVQGCVSDLSDHLFPLLFRLRLLILCAPLTRRRTTSSTRTAGPSTSRRGGRRSTLTSLPRTTRRPSRAGCPPLTRPWRKLLVVCLL